MPPYMDPRWTRFLPKSTTYTQWQQLNHWFRMKMFTEVYPPMKPFMDIYKVAKNLKDPTNPVEFWHYRPIQYLYSQSFDLILGDPLSRSNDKENMFMFSLMRLRGAVYSVAPDLAKLLKHTNLDKIDCSLVRAPHQIMYVQFPPSKDLQVYNLETGWHDAEGAYVVESTRITNEVLEELPTGVKDGSLYRELRIMVIGKSKDPDNIWDDAVFNFRMPMIDDIPVKDIIKQEAKTATEYWGAHAEEAELTASKVFNFIVNVLLYCTSTDPDIIKQVNPAWQTLLNRAKKARSAKKRKRLNKELQDVDKNEINILGSKLIIGKIPNKPKDIRPSTGANRKPMTPHMRSGHWRSHGIGPYKTYIDHFGHERRIYEKYKNTWIRPTIVGLNIAKNIRSTYTVDLPK